MNHLRRAFAFLAAFIVLSSGGSALAQTTTLKINKAGIGHSVPRTNNRNLTLINRADCESDDKVSFPVSLTYPGTARLQAWVGTSDCTNKDTRQLATQTTCWKVYDSVPGGNNPNTPTLEIPVRSLLAGFTCGAGAGSNSSSAGASSVAGSGGDTGSGGAATAGSGGASSSNTGSCISPLELVNVGPEACVQSSSTTAGATTLTLYIMLVDGSTFAATAQDTWVATFKLVGPPAPDKFSVGIGGNLLVTNFSYSSPPSDQTGNGFYLFCDPPPSRDAAVDAGLLDPDAGSGNTYTCGAPTSQVLVPGKDAPSRDSVYRCGSVSSKSAQSANATNLVNGVAYNVAVAAVDTYDNTGPLSDLACEVPQPVTGFFKGYRDAGGEGGGGFCSFSRHGEPLTLIGVLGFASYLVFRRRRAA
jgi:hypothetical protein